MLSPQRGIILASQKPRQHPSWMGFFAKVPHTGSGAQEKVGARFLGCPQSLKEQADGCRIVTARLLWRLAAPGANTSPPYIPANLPHQWFCFADAPLFHKGTSALQTKKCQVPTGQLQNKKHESHLLAHSIQIQLLRLCQKCLSFEGGLFYSFNPLPE